MKLKEYKEYHRHNCAPAFHQLCALSAEKATIHHADFSLHRVLGKVGIEDDDETIIEYLYQWHVVENGWKNGIGYHLVITPDGRILLTWRGMKGLVGAHARGKNDGNVGVLVWGDFNGNEYPTEEQEKTIETVRLLLEGICCIQHFYLHSDLNETKCPGDNFPEHLWK